MPTDANTPDFLFHTCRRLHFDLITHKPIAQQHVPRIAA
jgi:hypothetical protein